MKTLSAWLLLFVSLVASSADTPLQSPEDLSRWMTHHYRNPEPDRFVEAVRLMARSGMLDSERTKAPAFGFIAGIVRKHPDRLAAWAKQLADLNDVQMGVVVLGIWYADVPASKKTVSEILAARSGLAENLSLLSEGSPMPITKIPLEQGAWTLDANWGAFLASGDSEPVVRIMSALPWINVKGDVNKLATAGAARWSLTSNAVQHARVFDICESEIAKQPPEVAAELETIVAEARKQRPPKSL